MGIYDVNLKKTGVGYQFDHNVYIGIQTNDNRVVTFKDLDDAVATQIAAAGGGEDIELFITKSGAGAHADFGDRISFHRNNTEYEYDIAPQYVTSPGPISTQDWSSAKVCLLKPVLNEGQTIGYQIYTSDYAPASLLTLNVGATSYTYNGSAGVEINFNTIPTINADSVAITTSINSSSPSGAIPTDAAVLEALAWAPGIATVTPSSVTAATVAITSIAYDSANHSLNYDYIGQSFSDATLQWNDTIQYASIGGTTYGISLPPTNTIPTINAASVDITTVVDNDSTNTEIPTALAVYGALALAPGIAHVVPTTTGTAAAMVTNITYTGGSSRTLSYTTISYDFDDVTLDWGQPVQYASIGDETYDITLPTVNTIPTINADSVSITTQITSSHSSAIPTEGAVYEFAAAAGSVKATAATSGYILGTSDGVTATSATIAYTPVGTNDLRWADSTTGLPTASKWINANITGTLNKTFTVFGQAYDGSDNKTVTASYGIAVSNGVVSLDATFTHPTLVWGQPVTYATVANTDYTITLPTVDTIPTINASSVEISTSVPSQGASNSKIPTEKAVFDALAMAPGISSVTATGTAGMMTSLTYDPASHVLSYTQAVAAISGQTVTLGSNSVTVPEIGTASTQAAAGNHTHSTFTVFGQAYDGSSSKTISKGDGIAVSDGEVSLDATFRNPTLAWGASESYAVVAGTTHYITLPAVNTIPTINASSVSITTSISSSHSTAIPTEGAVSAAIAGAVPNITAGNNITITTYTNSPNVSVGLELIDHWINYKSTSGTHMATDDVGRIHLYSNFEYQILDYNDPVVMIQPQAIYINPNASTTNSVSLTINTYGISAATHVWVPTVNSSSSDYAAANKGYVDNISMTYNATTNIVTFTNAAGASISFTTASDWSDITGKPTLSVSGQTVTIDTNSVTVPEIGTAATQAAAGNHTHPTFSVFGVGYTGAASQTITAGTGLSVSNGNVSVNATFETITLAWNNATNYVNFGGTNYAISLPSVSTIPTINASSIGITTTISGTTDIPTDQAVNTKLAGYVAKTAFEYDTSTGVLTLKGIIV